MGFVRNMMVAVGLLTLSTGPLSAAEYYISPTGSDTNPGSQASPWKSIGKANAILQPGDTAYLMSGEYREQIKPARSGTSGNYITYRAYPGHQPVITSPPQRIAVVLQGRSYVRIDGLTIDGKRPYKDSSIDQWMIMENAHYNVVQNSEFKYARGWTGISLEESNYNKILNNRIDHVGAYFDPVIEEGVGNAMQVACSEHNLIEGNFVTRGGHDLLALSADYNVIRNNIFDNRWGDNEGYRAVSISANRRSCDRAKGYNVFEDNIVRNALFAPAGFRGSDEDVTPPAMKVGGINQIVRRNIFSNNVGAAISGAIRLPVIPEQRAHKIYNNIVHKTGGLWRARDYGNPGPFDKTVFKNNLIHDGRDSSAMWINFEHSGRTPLENNYIISNAFSGPSGAGSFEIRGLGSKTLAWLQSNQSAYFKNNTEAPPEFASTNPQDADYFHLGPNSSMIDSGDFLTRTTGSGSGKTVSVVDAGWFTDGFGITEGDLVKIGSGAPIRVTGVNYASNTLTLESSASWAAGATVSLPYEGAAPDIGAFEFRDESSVALTAPTNVQIQKQ
jgi:hypothetical protein